MKLSLILEAIDRASRPVERVDRATTNLGRASKRSALDVRSLDQRMEGASRSAGRLERASRRVGTGLVSGSRQGIRALAALDRRIQFSQAQMEKMAYRTGSVIGGTLRTGLLAGTALGGAGLAAAMYKVVTAGLTFEKFRTQLEGLEGSAAAGERALTWVSDFAAKTPYELTEVMEAFIALRAYGIDPTNGTLRSLGDTAAGMGKGLMQAVEMIADAQTGEFERIKEFGIKASVAGDKVTFRWQRNGKELSKTVKQTSTEIQKALLGIMDERFSGGMARLALTTEGKWSNLMDGLSRTANRVWEGGFGNAVNKHITRINSALDTMEKDGSLKKWADEAGQGIGEFIDAVGNYDWEGLGRDLQTTGQALRTVASGINAIGDASRSVRGFIGDIERLAGIGGSVSIDPRGGLRYNMPDWAKPRPVPAKPSGVPFIGAATRQNPALTRLRSTPVPFIGADRPSPARPARSTAPKQGATPPAARPFPTAMRQAAPQGAKATAVQPAPSTRNGTRPAPSSTVPRPQRPKPVATMTPTPSRAVARPSPHPSATTPREAAPQWPKPSPRISSPSRPREAAPRAASQRPIRPAPATSSRIAQPAPKPAPPAKGKLEISIKTDRDTTAKTTKLSATGMDVNVNVGRAMGGFA